MSLATVIMDDMKHFMREKDAASLEVIRVLRADIKNAEIEKKRELDDAEVLKIIQSSIKKHKEAGEIFQKAGRSDLVGKENKYVEILAKYMPVQLDKEEIKKIIREIVAGMPNLDPKADFGTVMKTAMGKAGAGADGKMISALVREVLDGNH